VREGRDAWGGEEKAKAQGARGERERGRREEREGCVLLKQGIREKMAFN
jgi:hypothetical protein